MNNSDYVYTKLPTEEKEEEAEFDDKPDLELEPNNEDIDQTNVEMEIGHDEAPAKKSEKDVKVRRRNDKITFVCSCSMIAVLALGMISFQWIIPYIYSVMTPILIGIRIVMYWKRTWHYFLLDFCYFANIFCLIFLCVPSNEYIFSIMFSLSTGPLIWAVPIYRNSLVLHSVDKVTSTYIHILPPILSYVARWYPKETSRYWWAEFLPEVPGLSATWTYFIPFIAFVFHSFLYSLVVNIFYRPNNDVVSSYSYLGEKPGFLHTLFNCLGNKYRCGMFYFWNWVFCAVTLIGSILSYYVFTINWLCILLLSLNAIWNGGSYYVHVFAVRGFVEEIE